MDSEDVDHSFGCVRLIEGDVDESELPHEEDINEGAVGFSPSQDNWLPCAFNEPALIEETDKGSVCTPRKRTPSCGECVLEGLRERAVYSNRRHSFSGTPIRRRSVPVLEEINSCNCQSSLAQQLAVPWIRSENGMVRRESAPSFPCERPKARQVRRNSLQVDRPLFHREANESLSSISGPAQNSSSQSLNPPNDVALIGSDLFVMFLREEIERSEIRSPHRLISQDDLPQFSRGVIDNREFMEMGSHLRSMADEFAKSEQRIRVRDRAYSVNLRTLDFTSFTDLLFGMFQEGGMTSERVLVLFTFCTDLAIRALQEKLQTRFYELTQWSRQYIMSWLSPWVQYHGGWAVVLERSVNEVYKVAIIGVCIMGMIAFGVYIRNNCR